MELNLVSHPLLYDLVQQNMLQMKEVLVEPGGTSSSVTYVRRNNADALLLVVDHSHFTAKRSEFSIPGDKAEEISTRVLLAIQELVVGLQARTLEMLGSVNAAVINSLDDTEIVHNVLREAMNVLPHCNAGVFRLFDEKSGFLVPVSHEGLPDDYTDYRLLPNESVSGEVFSTGQPAIYNGRQNIIDAHRVMRPESQSFMERSNIANALLCVPVKVDGKRLGTLTTLCSSSDGVFSTFDQTVLETLSAQIAVAYQRSLTYRNAVATSHRLEQMRNDLARKNADLDRALELHETLLRIFSANNDLRDQLHAVSELYRIDFQFENVLGTGYQSAGWTEGADVLDQVVEVAEAPVGHFHFVMSEDVSFHRALFGTLAAFVALDFVRDVSRIDLLNAKKQAYFDALLAGSDIDHRKSSDGFRLDRFTQVFVAKIQRGEASGNAHLSLHKSQSDLQKGISLSNVLLFHEEDRIVVLASASTTAALERNFRAVSEVAKSRDLYVGAGNVQEEIIHQQQARGLALQAAEALSRRGRPGVLRYRDMGFEMLLDGRDRRDVLSFVRQILDPLLVDAKHRGLLDTLSSYVREGKSATRTAQALGIHTNTLYQRLLRVEALTGRRISDAADFTLLSLACQLHAEYSWENPAR
jgi:GAF domain-containing protein